MCLGAVLGWAGCRLWQTPTAAIETVRRGGMVSLSGAYGGMADPLRTRSAWTNLLLIGCRSPRPGGVGIFQRKADGAVKIMLKPWS